MPGRPTIVVVAFAAGAAIVAFTPGLSTTLQRAVGIGKQTATAASPVKTDVPEPGSALIPMSEEQVKLAQIEMVSARPASVAKRLIVPGTIVPHADHIVHVAVKLSGTVAELRKNIGDQVAKGEVIAVLESREVADAKSEYLAARLTNDLQQDLSARDKALWDSRAGA